MRLMTGTTSSPLGTGSVPLVTKQFCTSTTISALAEPGLILLAARATSGRPVTPIRPAPDSRPRNERRLEMVIIGSPREVERGLTQSGRHDAPARRRPAPP